MAAAAAAGTPLTPPRRRPNTHTHPNNKIKGELPSGLERVSFVWERGSKIFATEAEEVNPHTRAVFWKQFLRQVSEVLLLLLRCRGAC